jgi:hypothetical protein
MRRRFKSSTSSARGWCVRIRTGSAAGPASTLKSMKPGSVAGRAAKAVASTIRFLSSVLWRFASASRVPSSTSGRVGPGVFDSPSCQTKRGVALRLHRVCRCAGHVARHRRLERLRQARQARLQTPRHRRTRRSSGRRGVSANHPSRLRKPESVVERHPSRGQSPAPASLPQRIHLPLQHFNRRFYPFNAFRSLLGIAGGITAPTYAELYFGAWKHPTSWGCG